MLKILRVSPIFCFLFLPHYSFAIAKTCQVEIRITDLTNENIPGVAVEVLEINQGAITDAEGKVAFSLEQNKTFTIRATSMGFDQVMQTIKIADRDFMQLTIQMNESTVELQEVTVEEDAVREMTAKEPYSLEMVDLAEIRHQPKDMARIINQLPGVRIRQEGGLGSNNNIMLNGIDGQGVRIFFDGFPVFLLGSTYSINTISPGIIERIEVYKGTIPVTFGSDALGGIINLVSRSENTEYFDLGYSFGSWNTHKVSFNSRKHWMKNGEVFTEFDGFYAYSENDYWMDDVDVIIDGDTNFNTEKGRARRFNDAFESFMGRMKFGVRDLSWADEIIILASYSEVFKEQQHTVRADRPIGEAFSEQDVWNAMVLFKKRWGQSKGDLALAAGYTRDKFIYVDTASRAYFWDQTVVNNQGSGLRGESDVLSNGTLPVLRANSVFGRGNFNCAIHPSHTLNLTSLVYNSEFNAANEALLEAQRKGLREPQYLISAYTGISLESKLAESKVTNVASVKHYFTDVDGVEYLGQGFVGERQAQSNAIWGYGNVVKYWPIATLSLNLGYEYTVRQPNSLEIFGDFFQIRSNPYLTPERSHNINLGANYFLDKLRMRIDWSLFFRDTEDRIYLAVSPFTSQYDNLASTRALGTTANVSYEPIQNMNLNINATYQDITLQAIDPDSPLEPRFIGSNLPNTPHLFANGQINYRFPDTFLKGSNLNVSTSLNYVEEFFLSWSDEGRRNTKDVIPRQVVQDIGFSWAAPGERWSVGMECRNLWDAKAFDNFSVQKPGRGFFVQARMFMKKENRATTNIN
ncbi:MAG: TonB-dependent receptor [Bacteroidota bacterium]